MHVNADFHGIADGEQKELQFGQLIAPVRHFFIMAAGFKNAPALAIEIRVQDEASILGLEPGGPGMRMIGKQFLPIPVVLGTVGFQEADFHSGQGSEAGGQVFVPIDQDGIHGQVSAKARDLSFPGGLGDL